MEWSKRIFLATSILIGTIVGAGILGLPYAFQKSGIILGIISLIVATIIMVVSSIILIEMGEKGEEISKVIGKNLGKHGILLASIPIILAQFGAAVAYNKGIGQLLQDFTGIKDYIIMLPIVLVFSIFGYIGIKGVAKAESVLVVLLITFLFIISFYLIPYISKDNLRKINPRLFFYAFGASMFAVAGLSSVPDILKIVNKKEAIVATMLSYIFVLGLYTLFSIAFVGSFGYKIREIAIENLSGVPYYIGAFVAIISMGTSYLILSYVVSRVLYHDLQLEKKKYGKIISVFFAYFLPYIVAFGTGFGFADIISITGGIMLSLTGVLIGISYIRYSKGNLEKFVGAILSGIYVLLLIIVSVGFI